jgi:hypothetical protein
MHFERVLFKIYADKVRLDWVCLISEEFRGIFGGVGLDGWSIEILRN